MRAIIPLLFMIIPLYVIAQPPQTELDSLLDLNKTKTGEDKVNNLINISRLYFIEGDTLSFKYGNDAVNLSKEIGFKEGIGKAYLFIGLSFQAVNLDSAINYFDLSSDILSELGHEWAGYGYENNSRIYREKGWLPEALETDIKALKAYEAHNDTVMVSKMMSSIGYLNNRMGNPQEGLNWQLKAMETIAGHDNYEINGLINGRIGISYDELGIFDSALIYNNKAIEIFREAGDHYYLAQWLGNIANTLIKQEKYSKAEGYLKEAIEKYRSDENISNNFNNLGKVYLETGKYALADGILDSAEYYSKKFQHHIVLSETYYRKFELRKLQGKLASALDFYQKYNSIKDSVYNVDKNEKIARMKVMYDTEEKENELLLNKAENEKLLKDNALKDLALAEEKAAKKQQRYIFYAGGGFLLFIALGLFLRSKINAAEERRKQEKLRFKAVIEAEEKERIRIAKDLHDGLGQLLATAKLNVASLEDEVDEEDKSLVINSMSLIDDAVTEVRNISHNMMPVSLIEFGLVRAIETLTGKINDTGLLKVELSSSGFGERVEQSTEIALYRIIQEALNNIIKHSKASNIFIDITKQSDKLRLIISDDGKGLKESSIENSKGIGWKNIYSRLSMINGILKINSSPNKGTSLNIDVVL